MKSKPKSKPKPQNKRRETVPRKVIPACYRQTDDDIINRLVLIADQGGIHARHIPELFTIRQSGTRALCTEWGVTEKDLNAKNISRASVAQHHLIHKTVNILASMLPPAPTPAVTATLDKDGERIVQWMGHDGWTAEHVTAVLTALQINAPAEAIERQLQIGKTCRKEIPLAEQMKFYQTLAKVTR